MNIIDEVISSKSELKIHTNKIRKNIKYIRSGKSHKIAFMEMLAFMPEEFLKDPYTRSVAKVLAIDIIKEKENG